MSFKPKLSFSGNEVAGDGDLAEARRALHIEYKCVQLITIYPAELASLNSVQARTHCEHLEAGDVLFFPQTPVPVSGEDHDFLLNQEQVGSGYHKNIAYRPYEDRVTGFARKAAASAGTDTNAKGTHEIESRLVAIMRKYSQDVEAFLKGFLATYQSRWHKDFASYRPQEEEGRDLSVRKRNDLLHTDAFPTRPTNGGRILRFFNNINPSQTRNWMTTETFDVLVNKMCAKDPMFFETLPAPMDGQSMPEGSRDETGVALPTTMRDPTMRRVLRSCGLGDFLPTLWRSPYDDFMLRFHHYLKENEHFQKSCVKQYWEFPPGSSWMVYTDVVSHAVLSGRFALEQTFIVAKDAMVNPERSPYCLLAGLASPIRGATPGK